MLPGSRAGGCSGTQLLVFPILRPPSPIPGYWGLRTQQPPPLPHCCLTWATSWLLPGLSFPLQSMSTVTPFVPRPTGVTEHRRGREQNSYTLGHVTPRLPDLPPQSARCSSEGPHGSTRPPPRAIYSPQKVPSHLQHMLGKPRDLKSPDFPGPLALAFPSSPWFLPGRSAAPP